MMDWLEVARLSSFGVFAAGLAWFMSGRFRSTELRLESLLDNHEGQDQRRHEENVVRFTKIETKLDYLNHHDPVRS